MAAAQGDLEIAREGYLAATGRFPGPLDAPPPLPRLPASVDEARAIGQRNHPLIAQAQRQAAAAELGVAAAAAESFRALRPALRHLLSASGSGRELEIGVASTDRMLASGIRPATVAEAAELDASDVVPVLPHAQSLVMLEQIMGVLYIAMVISRLVALTVIKSRS